MHLGVNVPIWFSAVLLWLWITLYLSINKAQSLFQIWLLEIIPNAMSMRYFTSRSFFSPCQWVLYSYLWSAASVFLTHSNNEPQVVDHVFTIQVNGGSSGNWSHQNRGNHALSIPCSSVPCFLPWLARYILHVWYSLYHNHCWFAVSEQIIATSQSPHNHLTVQYMTSSIGE